MKDQKVVETSESKKHVDTVVHVILDMSGSMGKIAQATRDGLNNYIESLKKDKVDDVTLVSVTVFDADWGYGQGSTSRIDTVIDSMPLDDVPTITDQHYVPRGGTPMYDAIGETVERTDKALAGFSGEPEVLLVIITDGDENQSNRFTQSDIKALIEQKEGLGWSTIYLGANQNAWAVGSALGIQAGNTKSYQASNAGIQDDVFGAVADATMCYRSMKVSAKLAGVGDGYTTSAFFAEGDTEEKEES